MILRMNTWGALLIAGVLLLTTGCVGSPLMRAAKRGDFEGAEQALLNGATVAERDRKGNTALHFAAQRDVRAALPGLADLDKPGAWETLKAGRILTRGLDDALLLDLLLTAGADPNAQNAGGESPLHVAARHNSPHTALILLARGANPDLKDNIGRTPAQLAMQYGARAVAEQLEKIETLPNRLPTTTPKTGTTTAPSKSASPGRQPTPRASGPAGTPPSQNR